MSKVVPEQVTARVFRALKIASVLLLMILLSVLSAGCGAQKSSNFGVEQWKGRLLDGTPINFAALKNRKVILNAYSPTCVPCIHELPALDRIHAKARKSGSAMFIIVEGRPIMHGIQKEGDHFQLIRDRLKQDIARYDIRIPFVIMDKGFRVSRTEGLVTATPETLIMNTQPLILEYNFIGPIALPIRDAKGKIISGKGPPALVDGQLKRDSRFQFVMSKI